MMPYSTANASSGERDADWLDGPDTLLCGAEALIGIAEGSTSDGIGGAI
jgi:hypothetical protein